MAMVRSIIRKGLYAAARLAGDRGYAERYHYALGYIPNVLWPRSFNEKLLKRKLSGFAPDWPRLADKVGVRPLVAERIGERYLSRVHLVTEDPSDLGLETLPGSFVLKASHGSGWNLIVRDKSAVDEATLRARGAQWLRSTYGVSTGETWYAAIKPRLIVEEFLEDATYGVPLDYKFWVFHGRVEFVQVDLDRFGAHRRNFYDRDWNLQPWGMQYAHGLSPGRPSLLGEMIEAAERLARNMDFVRVDLYCVNGERIVFGEMTLCPVAGSQGFWPDHRVDFHLGTFW